MFQLGKRVKMLHGKGIQMFQLAVVKMLQLAKVVKMLQLAKVVKMFQLAKGVKMLQLAKGVKSFS